MRLGPALALLAALPAFGCGGSGGDDPDGGSSDADAGPSVAVAVTAGLNHTCALTDEGGIKCWGGSRCGEIGSNDYPQSTAVPVDVIGFESGAVDVSAGSAHTCAVDADGGVWCWGDNWHGQLGAPVGIESYQPVPVVGLDHGYVSVSAGSSHTCALSEEGEVKCWGKNDWGALGDGTTQGSLEPVEVAGLKAGIASVDSGGGFTCAVTEGGGAKCWGMGGRCGDGSSETRLLPVDVVGLESGVVAVSAGSSHACALLEQGSLRCWGFAPLGDGTSEDALSPVDVSGGAWSTSSISAGERHSCSATEEGLGYCWGSNSYGQLGLGAAGGVEYEPAEVAGLDGVEITAVASGGHHTCALTSTGGIKCWGEYENGQLGNAMGADANEECVESDDCQIPTPVDVIGFGQ